MTVYRITLPNRKYGHLVPPEDSSKFEGRVFAVADGITRDPARSMNFKKKKIENILKGYPNPSGARFVADIFCGRFVGAAGAASGSAEAVRGAFLSANREIASFNKTHVKRVDYLVNDYFGCTAAGGVLRGSRLYWGVVGDCGIAVFDRRGRRKLTTPNSVAAFDRAVRSGKIVFRWETAGGRRLVRSEYRNKPDKTIGGLNVSYGALTGERAAEHFMYFGETKLSKGDLVVFYTDGFESYIGRRDFFATLCQPSESVLDQKFVPYNLNLAAKEPDKFGKERTLIAVRI